MAHWKYRNLLICFLGLLLAFFLSQNQNFKDFLLGLGGVGYLGILITGLLFSFSFTTPISIVIFSILSKNFSPIELALIGAIGSVFADLTIFRFVKDGLIEEITPLYNRFGGNHLTHILHSKYFHWTLPVLGSLIIASPLPDELGVTLLGISKMKTFEFIPISYAMNAVGIFIFVEFFSLLK